MEQENKNQIAQSLSLVKEQIKRWEKVYNITQDILAFINRDVRRFRIEIDLAVGMRFIRIWLTGTERYVYYGESASELSQADI